MLIQFNFKNYKSFRDEVSLDLTATKIREHSDHVVPVGNDHLLNIAGIYGANASGKSGICEAFTFMSYYVLESFGFGGESKTRRVERDRLLFLRNFAFDDVSKQGESTFEVFFIAPVGKSYKTYQYGFAIKAGQIIEEWLYSKAKTATEYKTIFYRKGNKIEMPGIPQRSTENIKAALESETLIVSLGAKLRMQNLKLVRDWFFANEIASFRDPYELYVRSRFAPIALKEERVQQNILRYFASFDNSIKQLSVEEDPEHEEVLTIEALHQKIDSDELASIPLSEESQGTLAMFSLYPTLVEVLNRGSVLVIDEINARLHPLLVRNIILTFLDERTNPRHAQLIFTTHDVWQLSNDLLRRDEIWFTEKDNNGVSSLYSLADFTDEHGDKIRKDANYAKNYLVGKYGAIPSLKPLDVMGDDL